MLEADEILERSELGCLEEENSLTPTFVVHHGNMDSIYDTNAEYCQGVELGMLNENAGSVDTKLSLSEESSPQTLILVFIASCLVLPKWMSCHIKAPAEHSHDACTLQQLEPHFLSEAQS